MMVGRFQRAREEGKAEGHAEGERAVLGLQLRRRFGPLPSEAAERIGTASTADLEAWAENVLDADTLDEVFDSKHAINP